MIVFSVSSFTSLKAATRTSNFNTRHRHRHHHRKTSSSQNVRSSSGKGGADDGDEHNHHHHHAPSSSSSLVVNRRAVVLERPAKLAVLSFLLLLSSSSSSPDDAFAKGGKSLEEKERAKDARKRALRAAAERAKETGVGGAAFSDSEYMVGEDHSPNQHSHQEEGSKGSFV